MTPDQSPAPAEGTLPKSRILLVEDNPDDEMLATRSIRRGLGDIAVTVARDGQEAIDLVSSPNTGTFEMVLLDLKLPKVSGVEVLRFLRSHEPTRFLPVVVLTSSDERRDLLECYAGGANSYVRKPIDFQDYQTMIRETVGYWLRWNLRPDQHSAAGAAASSGNA